ncbi:single-stranded DNA-binding protein WHY2, mitochondrial-like [Apium graveolens]|uniref:single-stranded DNA-binding protein WHY2, mitochondrial-like n=1 Tax=Apium graveolens TaxID=4045 RepID=UPI003D7BC221
MASILRPLFRPNAINAWENVANSLMELRVMPKACISTTIQSFSNNGKMSDRVFANYNIYKGKVALSASPRLPQFSKLDSGAFKVDRQGTIMLSFSPAIGERKYDWEKKQLFALSPTEVGSLISLGPDDTCEFFHDPSMKSSNAGQVRKTLQVKPYSDGTGYFISLSVVNNILKISDRFTIPVTRAEFAVMRTAFSFVLPHILGWDQYTNQSARTVKEDAPMVDPRVKNLEWDR